MSGFFSLGGKEQELQGQQSDHKISSSSSLFLFKNSEIYNKGFELWQQYHQLHQQRVQFHHHAQLQQLEFSAGPSSGGSFIPAGNSTGDGSSNYSYRSGSGFRVTSSQGKGGNAGMNCQDCGNQAKKDCVHLRCRTCCKSRGFACQTHLKSTWVPAAKRRERQQQQTAAGREECPKRLREDPAAVGGGGTEGSIILASSSTPRLPATTSGFELAHFPSEVNSAAVFRCVRVRAMDFAEEQFAYQTAINIGGHVFKGILYDQGRESQCPSGGESSSGNQLFHPITATSAAVAASTSQNMEMLEYPPIYPPPLSAFMAGTQFFSPPRP